MRSRRRTRRGSTGLIALALVVPVACGGDDAADTGPRQLTLITYDSFPVADTSLNDALAAFTADTGIAVTIATAGDTGTMVSKAVLTAGNPEGDVMWGVDDASLSRALAADVFEPYRATGIDTVPIDLQALAPDAAVTPVSFGDVCINYDIGWFDDEGLTPPDSFDDLLRPEYADLLVVQNPATSSPGLAFLLATITAAGEAGWQDYWQALRANGVEITDGWTEAYYERSTWAGGGPRPMVVSYGSSPPAEVLFADPPIDRAPTGVIVDTCYRQVEFAGVLRGTGAPEEARQLVDFLLAEQFQRELALNLFVYPANSTVELPPVFVDHATVPDAPRSMDPATIDARRADWIDEWTDIVVN